MSVQEIAFQTFVFRRVRHYEGFRLSTQQRLAYTFHNKGVKTSDIAKLLNINVSSVHTLYAAIKIKGWSL